MASADNNRPPDTRQKGNEGLSKSLTWLLRHNAPQEKVQVHPGGYVDVEAVLGHPRFKRWTEDDIRAVVQNCDKQRFALKTNPQTRKLQIRATRGHSFDIDNPTDDPNLPAGGHRHRGHRPRKPIDPKGNEALSKSLTWLLRHNAPKEKVQVHPGGFVDVESVLKHRRFKAWNEEDVKTAVQNCEKQRFALQTDPQTGKLQIRCNQGHSFPIDDLQLAEITDAADCPVVIHGTYLRNWESIKKSGLSRMNRNHIHFAAGEPGTTGVISGLRRSADIHVYIDLPKALQDGIKFYRSENNVILSPGNDKGYVLAAYFLKVINTRSGQNLV